ncbi:hypothetical protein ACFL6N_07665, partial [Thermodesulfobacteriota bacterium]
IQELLSEFPYDGWPYMLQADLFIRRQQPMKAMFQYKDGVNFNPDFLDKKTELFQGKKIKVHLEEARVEIMNGLQNHPDDKVFKKSLKTYYYMKRKIAGSCG